VYGVTDPAVEEAVRAYVKLMRASRSVLARVEPALAARGLTPTQLGVLEALLHKGAMTHRELGRKVLTSAGNMSDVVDKLERRDLVARLPDPADRAFAEELVAPYGPLVGQVLAPRAEETDRHGPELAEHPGAEDGP